MERIGSRNDITAFFRDLKKGQPIRMLIAPAAAQCFADFPRVLGFLWEQGVVSFHPVLPFADIAVWVYYTMLRENPEARFITSACVGMNRLLEERFPQFGGALPRVYSPLLCAARYLRGYKKLNGSFAFLSPCALKWKEFTTPEGEELVRYNVTIDALNRWFEANPADLSRYEPCFPETGENGHGLTLAAFGSIGKSLEFLFPEITSRVEQGTADSLAYLSGGIMEREEGPFVFEPYACPGGCSNGAGIGKKRTSGDIGFLKCRPSTAREDVVGLFSRFERELAVGDFQYGQTMAGTGQTAAAG
ncbi:[Fe-Fe] hydrogenase large subunit C-terminal domain-containing protein [Breznakiella homolactica]|uniref:Iron hydrogenase large subunit C-terminal domain-containing protein n=1 Tax=Breznakiella homolactica TaxID=2798577 RepID=A0A7T7XN36_9SPIR|nr:[Fe-Fe] hydrogenase large subunit C-terminal domain-containing protein [Breznakiella homolactica]QQO09385.1 hypothetical protein JFL75_00230 [Breznakiella homolactica]